MVPSLPSILARLRFRHLSLLIALDEHGSLHKAAQRTGMTQPGLTRALHEIELTFGAPLFTRSARGMAATELGQCVLRHARLIAADVGQLREEIEGVLRGSGGRIAVGAIAGALHGVLVAAIGRLRAQQPALSVEVREATSVELLQLLGEGRLDLAVCRTTVLPYPEQFHYEPLLDEHVAVAAHPRHPLLQAGPVTLDQLAGCAWIFYPAHLPLRSLLERAFHEAGLALPRHAVETASTFATMLLLREDTQAVALMTEATMAFCEHHGVAARLPIAITARHEGYGIVTRHGAQSSPLTGMLAQCLRDAARAQPGPAAPA
ncbi:LysR family transcriptional regulator [Pseudorhodoferax sp. Leaf267]|uniref:LysR family transcriptional regulator n=1 Tax=Pseudorhodoferax sp. Leaf267 TaxID=1736316 RepID=UPI0006FEB75E|nr:LysR family transcriptional regulator [Pseudorhodoferax sp. Leaf267]KQP12486.1 LysR family transcriptional regulator [Pseudorhodoferax sp. Leaf267]